LFFLMYFFNYKQKNRLLQDTCLCEIFPLILCVQRTI